MYKCVGIEDMLKQQQPPVRMELKKKRSSSFQKDEKTGGVDEQVLDLSGMSLETLPVVLNPSLNVTLVTTLDLSSNFLQVCSYGIMALFTYYVCVE